MEMDIDDLIEDACEAHEDAFDEVPAPPDDWEEASAQQAVPATAAAPAQPVQTANAQAAAQPPQGVLPASQAPMRQVPASQDVGSSQMSCARAPRPKLVCLATSWLLHAPLPLVLSGTPGLCSCTLIVTVVVIASRFCITARRSEEFET